jgi:hypothetical protein
MIISPISQQTRHAGEESARRDRSHDLRATALGVPTETTDQEREDGLEDAGFKGQEEGEHSHAFFAVDADCGSNEDHDGSHEDHKDNAGLHKHREPSGSGDVRLEARGATGGDNFALGKHYNLRLLAGRV